ncbi:right-handed parallel beta-helix repeat-containing protein [Paenibacillus barcinonensis]|nr:right-handed parallel beta-helix repeat-containing protein [Paenibacillus barcinonensis]
MSAALFLILLVPLQAARAAEVNRERIPLQPIIDKASPGAVIQLQAGTYSGPVVIRKPLTLIGDTAVTIINEQDKAAIFIQADDVKLRGFTMEHHGGQPTAAVHITGSNNEISELTIRTEGAGLLLRDAASAVLRNNTIEWAGASTASSTQKGNGIDLLNSDNSRIEGNHIQGVLDGIYLENSRNARVQDNRLLRTRYGIHCMYIDGSSVLNNTGEENMTGGMIMGVKNTIVTGNTFRKQSTNVHSQGILLYDVHQSEITSNTVEGNRVGMNIAESSNNEIRDNDITRNFVGIQMVLAEGNAFTQNRFVSNVIDASAMDSKGNKMKGNYWDSFQGLDVNQDGMSELSYAINPFYEQLISRNAAYQLFFQSPGMVFLSDLHSEGKGSWTTDETPQIRIGEEHTGAAAADGNTRSGLVGLLGLLLVGLSASTMIYMGVWRK